MNSILCHVRKMEGRFYGNSCRGVMFCIFLLSNYILVSATCHTLHPSILDKFKTLNTILPKKSLGWRRHVGLTVGWLTHKRRSERISRNVCRVKAHSSYSRSENAVWNHTLSEEWWLASVWKSSGSTSEDVRLAFARTAVPCSWYLVPTLPLQYIERSEPNFSVCANRNLLSPPDPLSTCFKRASLPRSITQNQRQTDSINNISSIPPVPTHALTQTYVHLHLSEF